MPHLPGRRSNGDNNTGDDDAAQRRFSLLSQVRNVTHASGPDRMSLVAGEGLEPPTRGL
jgi:hypothetical protein